MAAPSSTTWGSEVGGYGKIGIYKSTSSTATKTTVTVDVYLWTKYSCSDSSNDIYFDNASSSSSASTNRGSKSIKHTVDSGGGWSTSNQTKIYSNTYEYTRSTFDQTRYLYAKMTGIERVGGTMTASTTVKIPKLATYTVTFNANGGTDAPPSQSKTHGTALTLSSSKPTKTGYKFLGWSTSSSATSATWSAGGSYTTNASDTLYAVWAPYTLTVKYNANGGTAGSNAEYPIATHTNTWKYGDTGKTLINFSTFDISKTGYNRKDGAEWNTKADGSGTSFDEDVSYSMTTYAAGIKTADTTITVYAQWTPKKYTITFNPNGGSGGPTSQTKTYGVALTLSSSTPTRSGYTFKGWATSKTATTAAYSAGNTFSTNITANTTLYAVWQSNYAKPKISGFSVTRWSSNSTSGSSMDGGPYVRVKFTWSTSNNVSSITILCNGKTTTLSSSEASGTSGKVDKIVGDNALAEDTTYPITVTVTDSGGKTSTVKNAVGSAYVIDFLKGGTGCAIGKAAETAGYLDIKHKTRHRDHVYIDHSMGLLSYNTNNDSINMMSISSNDNVIIGYGNYEKQTGNTHLYGHDLNFFISNIATPGAFRPYRRRGDTITLNIRTAGFVTSSGTTVCFFVPCSVPIVGSPTATAASNSGFILRQGNNYTHGSSSTVAVSPTSYTATIFTYTGVYITATFSDATGVTNNDTIGVHWSGTITFS